jgi:hypothetical protein
MTSRVVEVLREGWRPIALAVMTIALAVGFAATIGVIPGIVALNRKDAAFEQDLMSRGITRFYSDYWTCDELNFETREGLVCAVVQNYGHLGFTRYLPYLAEVQADGHASYVLVTGSEIDETFQFVVAVNNRHYATTHLDGYTIYTPLTT